MSRLGDIATATVCLFVLTTAALAELPSGDRVRQATGIEAGLTVVLGTIDGRVEAELAGGGKMLVQGLTLDESACIEARRHSFAERLYGVASVDQVVAFCTLPYYDRLVNLLVADLDSLGSDAPSMDEIMRVLGYEGVAYLKQRGKWTKIVKPTPNTVVVRTHTFHDAGRSGGFGRQELRRIERLVAEHADHLLEAWNEFFGG